MQIENVSKALLRRGSDGKFLVLIGSEWPERPDRSHQPDLPGGAVEKVESLEDGCVREIREETGIIVDIGDLTLVHAASQLGGSGSTAINRLIYIADLPGEPSVTLSWEHESYQWMSIEEVLSLEIRQPYPEIFRYLATIGQLA